MKIKSDFLHFWSTYSTIKFDKLFLNALFILHLVLNQYLLLMQCSLIVNSLPCRKLLRIILVSLCLRDFTAISSLLPRTWVPFLCWTRSIACTLTLLTGRHSIYIRGNSKPTGESCRPWIVGMRYCRFLFLCKYLILQSCLSVSNRKDIKSWALNFCNVSIKYATMKRAGF